MADDELRLDLFVDGKDEAADKTEEIADNLDRVGETLDELKEKKIDILDEDQLKRLIELEKTLTKINIQIDRLEGRKRKTLGGDLEITQKLVDKHKTEKEIAIMTGQPQEETDRLQREIEKEQAREREIRDQIDRNIEASRDRLDRDGRDEQPGEAPPSRPPRPPSGAEEEEPDDTGRSGFAPFTILAGHALGQAASVAGSATGVSGLGGIFGGMAGAAGAAGLGVLGSLAVGGAFGGISLIALLAGMSAQRISESQEPASRYFRQMHQLAMIRGERPAETELAQMDIDYGVFGIMPTDTLRYSRQLADVFGSGLRPEHEVIPYALKSGSDPETVVAQISQLRRSLNVDKDPGFLLMAVESIRTSDALRGRGDLVIGNLTAMSQAHLSASGVMPTEEQGRSMLRAYSEIADTGETGAMFGGQFYSRFTGAVTGASGSTNAFLLRAFLSDPSVTSHTLEDFEYWKEQATGDAKVGYLMDYARKEFGENAPVALKRMGLMTVTEYKEYSGGIGKGKKLGFASIIPDPGEIYEQVAKYHYVKQLKEENILAAGLTPSIAGNLVIGAKGGVELFKGWMTKSGGDRRDYILNILKLSGSKDVDQDDGLVDLGDIYNLPVSTPTAIPTQSVVSEPTTYSTVEVTPTPIVRFSLTDEAKKIFKLEADTPDALTYIQEYT